MKKKIAILLASVMTLSMLPMTVFAATDNRLPKSAIAVPENALFFESGLVNTGVKIENDKGGTNVASGVNDNDNAADYYVDGTDLVIKQKSGGDTINPKDTIKLELTNAKWFFRSKVSGNTDDFASFYVNEAKTSTSGAAISNTLDNRTTYDLSKGTLDATDRYTNLYTRNQQVVSDVKEFVYSLEMSRTNDKVAILTVSDDPWNVDAEQIRIPLVSLSSKGDVKVSISQTGSTTITGGTYLYGYTAAAVTTTYVGGDGPEESRDYFDLDSIVVKETRVGSMRPGEFTLQAPAGYSFVRDSKNAGNNNETTYRVLVGTEPGISWIDTPAPTNPRSGVGESSNEPVSGSSSTSLSTSPGTGDYAIWYDVDDYGDVDESKIHVRLNINRSTSITGAVIIENLALVADETLNSYGDFKIKIRNVDGDPIAEEDFLAGKRVQSDVLLEVGDLTTLVAGRYVVDKDGLLTSDSDDYKTAKVTFKESVTDAWWAGRQTVFTLSSNAKFRRVEIHDTDGVDDTIEKVYQNTGKRDSNGYVTLDENTMTLHKLSLTGGKIKMEFDIWVSAAVGQEDKEVKLSVDVSKNIDVSTSAAEKLEKVIANIVDPVTVSATVSDVKVGYQYQKTADIVIKEVAAGYLKRYQQVRVSISDLTTSDMWFSPDTKVDVDALSGMKVKNVTLSSTGWVTTTHGSLGYTSYYGAQDANNTNNAVGFEVQSETSDTPATITLSNVQVRLDPTSPATSYADFKVIAWGSAIANNYGSERAQFNVPGVMATYIKASNTAAGSTFTNKVGVTKGQSSCTINGETKTMDAAAYISAKSNSMMVPVRFVAEALGLNKDSVIWDDSNKTVTIADQSGSGLVVQFKLNSDQMIINGVSTTMKSPDDKNVVAEITGEVGHERIYVPFRALGNAFGIPVSFDNATNTASYN